MRYLLAAALIVSISATASAQALPPPERSSTTWDTQALVNESHNFEPDALPDLQKRAAAGDARSQVLLGLIY
jgi:hypothetical protein